MVNRGQTEVKVRFLADFLVSRLGLLSRVSCLVSSAVSSGSPLLVTSGVGLVKVTLVGLVTSAVVSSAVTCVLSAVTAVLSACVRILLLALSSRSCYLGGRIYLRLTLPWRNGIWAARPSVPDRPKVVNEQIRA